MKKVFSFLIVIFLCAMSHNSQAQTPYKHSIGGYMGSMIGGSYKTFLNDHLVFEGELGFRFGNTVTLARYNYNRWWINLYTFEANPNLMYQAQIADWNFGSFHWFAGGGVSLGVGFWNGTGASCKLGVNAIGGVELAFRTIPLTCQIDFRPGYGQLAGSITAPFFDYAIGVSARYLLK